MKREYLFSEFKERANPAFHNGMVSVGLFEIVNYVDQGE